MHNLTIQCARAVNWCRSGFLALALSFLFLVGAGVTRADDETAAKAAKVKSVFLYNFIKFVEWPNGRSPATTHKADICVIGNSPFGGALNALKSTLSGQLDLTILMDISASDIGKCHVLYIGTGEEARLGAIVAAAQNAGVLTVSEASNFADNGGIIEMKTVQKTVGLFSSNKINLRVNLKAAEASSLKINAQLLEIAAEVIK